MVLPLTSPSVSNSLPLIKSVFTKIIFFSMPYFFNSFNQNSNKYDRECCRKNDSNYFHLRLIDKPALANPAHLNAPLYRDSSAPTCVFSIQSNGAYGNVVLEGRLIEASERTLSRKSDTAWRTKRLQFAIL
jgi:hypothetical protein